MAAVVPLTVFDALPIPAPDRDDAQHDRYTCREYGPPDIAAPGQVLWPVVLSIKKTPMNAVPDNLDFGVEARWAPVGGPGTAKPEEIHLTDIKVNYILNTDLPPELQIGAPNPVMHLIIGNIKVPTSDPPNATPLYGLFIKLFPKNGNQALPPFFHTSIRCYHNGKWEGSVNNSLRVMKGKTDGPPPPPPGAPPNVQIVDHRTKLRIMNSDHQAFLTQLRNMGKIDYEFSSTISVYD